MKKVVLVLLAVFLFNCNKDEQENLCDCTTRNYRKVTSSTSLIENWNLNSLNEFKGNCDLDGFIETYEEQLNGFNYFYRKETNCN
jgi:hypothetical protein